MINFNKDKIIETIKELVKSKSFIFMITIVFIIPAINDYLKETCFENIKYENISIKKPDELEISFLAHKEELYADGLWPTSFIFGKAPNENNLKRYSFIKKLDNYKKKSNNPKLIISFDESKKIKDTDFTWLPDLSVNKNTNFFNLNSYNSKCTKGIDSCMLDLTYKDIHIYLYMIKNDRRFNIPIDGKIIRITFDNHFNDNSILVELFDEINKIENLKN